MIDSIRPDFNKNSTCANQLSKDDFFDEFIDKQIAIEKKILNDELGINSAGSRTRVVNPEAEKDRWSRLGRKTGLG